MSYFDTGYSCKVFRGSNYLLYFYIFLIFYFAFGKYICGNLYWENIRLSYADILR